MAVVYIGIGSNLGDKEHNCLNAVKMLSRRGLDIQSVSKAYETEPWGVKDQPSFINMALAADTRLTPHELLDLLKDVEKRMGRTPSERYGPRIIDLDILLYDDISLKEEGLEIPHPHMHERDFVLSPLAEIAPDVLHPLCNKTISELRESLKKKQPESLT